MNYLPYKNKLITKKMTNNSKLDSYLLNLGFNNETIQYILNNPKENNLHLMHDMDNLILSIKELPKNTCFTIVSDYDADGVTSNTILYLILNKIGFNVNYYVPHRIMDGYGLSTKIVDKIGTMYPETDIIMTCDNGIAAVDAVKYAKEKGYAVYVTDHHTPDFDNLPPADLIVHPAFKEYPFADISGAEVAYKIAKGLMEAFAIKDVELSEYILQLAAISIVSDVMPVAMTDPNKMKFNENRTILQQGIELMREKPNWHLKTMFDMFKIENQILDETTIGFYIAPIINAVGRLSSASIAVDMLTTADQNEAILKCSTMGYMNEERKELKAKYLKEIKDKIDDTKKAIVVNPGEIHEGIIGIIAGNLCDLYQKPAVVFSLGEEDGIKFLKGSARSIDGVNLYDILKEINKNDDTIILRFGGHAGAAGLSIAYDKFDAFVVAFNEEIAKLGTINSVKYYINLLASDTDNFAKDLEQIKPLGNGLPKPLVNTSMYINSYDLFFKSGHIKLSNCFHNEFWLYNELDTFNKQTTNFDGFTKTHDNTESKMKKDGLSKLEATQVHWERWNSEKGVKPIYNILCELDYGNFMGELKPIYSVINYARR